MPDTAISNQSKILSYTKMALGGLGLQFVLGNVVAFWHLPPSEETATHKSPAFANISFDLHMLLALLLLIGAIYLFVIINKTGQKPLRTPALAALISIIFAVAGGASIFYAPESLIPVGLFIMALGFLGAFFNYGRLYLELRKAG